MTERNNQRRFRHLNREVMFEPISVTPPPLRTDYFPMITSLALDVVGRCNLKCVYCAEAATLPKRTAMPRRVLHHALEAVFGWSPRSTGVSLHLGSGEALLHPRAVQEIGTRAKRLAQSQNRPLALYLTTNGTLLNETIRSWLIDDGWNVKISIDGERETHDHYRRYRDGSGTFKSIEMAVRTLAAKIPDRFSTTSVLCHRTDPQEVFSSIASLGVKKIELVPVAAPSSSPFALSEDDLTAYRRFIFDYVHGVVKNKNMPTHIRFQKRLQRALGYGNTRIPCGAARTFIAVGPDGALYPCFRFVGVKRYRLGDLDSGIEPERLRWFTDEPGRPYERRTSCEKCWAAPLCGGPCFACVELLGRSDGSPPPDYCSMVRSESDAALWLAAILRDENPAKLIELLGIRFMGR